jgi:heme/copper-type cytochrome/quinol oxidase subunit 2
MKVWSDEMNRKTCALSLLAILIVISLLSAFHTEVASAAGAVRDFYVAAEYAFGGPGYNVFYPQTLVVEQGDQVNMTIRNVGTESFTLNIEGQSSIAIKPGSQNASGIQPTDTDVPVFTASNAGIFSFSADKFPEMNGQIVVLPTDPASYNPSTQTRSFTQLVFPDFAGDGYDKFFPGVIVVNQGDTVNVSVRNTDDAPHGFAIAAYDMNVAINPGQDQPNGSITPVTTSVQPFTASKSGVFRWFCTTPCGPGHFEMVGQLVVLPTQGTVYNPDINTMYSYLTIKPDYAGSNYSKYVPEVIFANQNDFVYIKVRNTDVNAYSFSMSGYSVNNVVISAGNYSDPSLTYIPSSSLYANTAGVFEFACNSNCTSASRQMNGYLVVLPTQKTSASPTPPPAAFSSFYAALSAAMIIIGIVIGIILAAIFARGRSKATKN